MKNQQKFFQFFPPMEQTLEQIFIPYNWKDQLLFVFAQHDFLPSCHKYSPFTTPPVLPFLTCTFTTHTAFNQQPVPQFMRLCPLPPRRYILHNQSIIIPYILEGLYMT